MVVAASGDNGGAGGGGWFSHSRLFLSLFISSLYFSSS
jgi:hypothetical protein